MPFLCKEAKLDGSTRKLSQQLKDAIDACVNCDLFNQTPHNPAAKHVIVKEEDMFAYFRSLSISLNKNESFVTGASVALVHAAMRNCVPCATILLEQGAKTTFNDPDVYGTALYQAVKGDHPEMVKLLIQHGANVNASCTVFGTKPLHEATTKCDNSCIQVLVDAGADVNGRRSDGFSVLTHALLQTEDENDRRAFRNTSNIRTLLKNGANLSLKLANHSLHESLLQSVQQEYEGESIDMSSLCTTLKILFDNGYKPKLSEFVQCISSLSDVEGDVINGVKFFLEHFTINELDVIDFDVFMFWVLDNIVDSLFDLDDKKANACKSNLGEVKRCFLLLTSAVVIYPHGLEARILKEKANLFKYKVEMLMEKDGTTNVPHFQLLFKFLDVMDWIEKQVKVLPSLKNLSRCALRKALGTKGLPQKVQQVELPKELEKFALLEDI